MKILVGTGLFVVGMLTQKQLTKFIRNRMAKERAKDYYASIDEFEKNHPKMYKVARCVASVVVFFI